MTASSLFASKNSEGVNRCYYCGTVCGDEYHTADYVKDTFTNRDIVRYPGFEFVCIGCVESMGQVGAVPNGNVNTIPTSSHG
jgi:hypothetical protein